MKIRIVDERMTSDVTEHTATWCAERAAGGDAGWVVSWLPWRCFDRSHAVTAMVLASTLADGDVRPGHRLWPHVEAWAGELSVGVDDAVAELRGGRGRR